MGLASFPILYMEIKRRVRRKKIHDTNEKNNVYPYWICCIAQFAKKNLIKYKFFISFPHHYRCCSSHNMNFFCASSMLLLCRFLHAYLTNRIIYEGCMVQSYFKCWMSLLLLFNSVGIKTGFYLAFCYSSAYFLCYKNFLVFLFFLYGSQNIFFSSWWIFFCIFAFFIYVWAVVVIVVV